MRPPPPPIAKNCSAAIYHPRPPPLPPPPIPLRQRPLVSCMSRRCACSPPAVPPVLPPPARAAAALASRRRVCGRWVGRFGYRIGRVVGFPHLGAGWLKVRRSATHTLTTNSLGPPCSSRTPPPWFRTWGPVARCEGARAMNGSGPPCSCRVFLFPFFSVLYVFRVERPLCEHHGHDRQRRRQCLSRRPCSHPPSPRRRAAAIGR